MTVNEGDSVRFLWGGEVLPHNSVEENGLFDSGDPEREVDYLYTFEIGQAGVYDFFCEPHESVGMDGTITVIEVEKNDELIIETSSSIDKESGSSLFLMAILIITVLILYRSRIDKISSI